MLPGTVVPVEGHVLIRNPYKRWRYVAAHALARSVRAAWACVLALALLTPILQEAVTLQGAESQCGMSCCKSGKNSSYCSRHRAKQSTPGVHWTAGDQCLKDCGQFFALPNPPGVSPANSTLYACPIVPASTMGNGSPVGPRVAVVNAALFQRPPPILL